MNKKFSLFCAEQVKALQEQKLAWTIRELQSPSGPRVQVDGKKVIMLCSNNYLGLSNHPALRKAAIEAVQKYGAGSGSVRAIAGTMDLHLKLEKEIAHFKGTGSSVYYQTGFATNAGLLPAVTGEKDLIISEELNHGSIIDGVRLSKAQKTVYKHKDMEGLERLLKENKGKFEKMFVVTDGVFSMDGDLAPLDHIVELAELHDAIVYVDDAHGDGVLGEKGKGISHHFHVAGKVDMEMGTFSKAFGVVGGYVCGEKEMCEYAYNKSRTWLLSGSAPPATVAACRAALQVLEESDALVKKLWKNTEHYKKALRDMGFDLGQSETPITPILLGESKIAQNFGQLLFEEGVFGLPIVYPMVAQGKARIRTMVTAEHAKEDLDEALGIIEKVGKRLKVI